MMKVTGGCHCGAISYEAEVEPQKVVICHCSACQQLSGSPFRAVAFTEPNSFQLLSGEPKIYVKTAGSGRKREQSFCGTCGTPIYAAPVEAKKPVVGLRVGTINERALLPPTRQIWTSAALPWADDCVNLPGIPGQP
jgi:hypothetical protein